MANLQERRKSGGEAESSNSGYQLHEFDHVIFRSKPELVASEFINTNYMFENIPFKQIVEDQKLEKFLRLESTTYPSQVEEFYENLQKHKTRDVLKTEVKGKQITLDVGWFVKHMGMENSGLVLRTDLDVVKNKYDAHLWLPEGFFGEKQATHWP